MPLACGSLCGGRGTGMGWPFFIEDFLLGVEKVGTEAASAGSARVLELGAPSAPPLTAAAKVRFWLPEAGSTQGKGTKVK